MNPSRSRYLRILSRAREAAQCTGFVGDIELLVYQALELYVACHGMRGATSIEDHRRDVREALRGWYDQRLARRQRRAA